MQEKGAIGVVFAIAFVIVGSLLLGFVVGALTDPNKSSDLRASAHEEKVTAVFESSDACKRTIRWYTIELYCY